MFRFLGQIVSHYWPLFLAGWVALAIATSLLAPPWDEVAQDKEFAFLPATAPSRQSEAVYRNAFPDEPLGSNIVLIIERQGRGPAELQRDKKFISDVLEPGLRKIAQEEGGLAAEVKPPEEPLFGKPSKPPPKPAPPSIIERIRTPNAPGSGALLVSPDRRVLLVVMELTTEFLSSRNWTTIDKVEHFIHELEDQGKLPPSVAISTTGSAVIGRDHTVAELRSADKTRLLTVALVIGLLILIYRAPLLAIIPLLTVFLTVQVSLNLLAIMGHRGYLTIFQGLQIYITILAYGAGVDYCLFLMARHKELLDHENLTCRDAVAESIGAVGAALTASAATVICGIGMMSFAQFGKFREAGMTIPLSLFLAVCATLTFSPTLLRLFGRWAFWPHHRPANSHVPTSGRGLRSWLSRGDRLYRGWEKVGQILARRPATCWLGAVAVMAPFVLIGCLLRNDLSYDVIGDLPSNAPSVAGSRVLQAHFPAGILGPATLVLVDSQVDFRSDRGQSLVKHLTDTLQAQQEDLGLADVRTLTAPLGITPATENALASFNLPADVRRKVLREQAVKHYVADLGERTKIGTRFDLILNQSPFSKESIDDLNRLEETVRAALPPDIRSQARLYLVGASASVRDLQNVMQQDRLRIQGLVVASVFVILVLLLRRFFVPLYLLASVLFSYFATLGVTFIVFWALDPHHFTGLDWKVAIFLFTILIAVGEDYNIFLISRIRQETKHHGPMRGITCALARTGPVISSCGIIMAGTFASLLVGSLSELQQLGFALAFGVLLDTFVVRPILVPAFLILIRRHRLSSATESPRRAA